jgi:hypothetical protein
MGNLALAIVEIARLAWDIHKKKCTNRAANRHGVGQIGTAQQVSKDIVKRRAD